MKGLKMGLVVLGFFIVFGVVGASDFEDFQMMHGIVIEPTPVWKIFTRALFGLILILLGSLLPETRKKNR